MSDHEHREEKREGSGNPQPYDRRHTWRKSEWISLATVATVLGWIYYASAKTQGWDQTSRDVAEIKPVLQELVKMESANEAHWQDISRYFNEKRRDR